MKEIDAVLFDMDGLIFNTESLHRLSWRKALRDQELPFDEELYLSCLGRRETESLIRLRDVYGHRINFLDFRRACGQDFIERRRQGLDFKRGFIGFFEHVTRRELKRALVTSATFADVNINFAGSRYLLDFHEVITAESVKFSKPNPECYLLACARFDIDPKKCLALEDSNNGVRAALDAGCMTAMIPDLVPPNPHNKKHADYIFDSLHDVMQLIP